MKGTQPITIQKVIDEVTVNNSNTTSKAIDLNHLAANGYFSVQVILTATGAPAIDVEYMLSHDGSTFYTSSSKIATGMAKADSGKIFSFEPELARWLKIKVTETNSADGTVTVYLATS